MKIACKNHPNSTIERVCASASCKRDPALCWECMIDEADHARNHRDVMIKIDEFAERLETEYKNLKEKRLKDKGMAMEGHLRLLEEKESYLERFSKAVNNRKSWCDAVISQTRQSFNDYFDKLEKGLQEDYDEKVKVYIENLNFIINAIEHRYGLEDLPTKENILKDLEHISSEKSDVNVYLQELKHKLLPPEDLNRNVAFLDAFREFDSANEMVDTLFEEINERLSHLEGKEDEYYDNEPIYQEIVKSVENQCQVVVDELKLLITCKDVILSRHQQQNYMEESLNTIPEGQFSTKKATIADKLYESPHLFETEKILSPFNENSPTVKLLSNREQDQQQQQQIKFVRPIETQQSRGITSLIQIDSRTIATGSRDKTIKLNVLDSNSPVILEGHIDQVTALCMFQDKLLISGGGNLDSSLIVWSLTNFKQIHRLNGHQSGITSIIELSDRSCILSGSYDNLAIIWNINEGKSICALKKHTAMVSSLLQVKRDIIVTGSWDRTMGIWQLQFENEEIVSANYVREMRSDGAVICMKKVNERLLVYGGTANKVNIVDWVSGEIKRKLSTFQFGICDLLVQGDTIYGLGASDSTIRVWRGGQEVEVCRDSRIQINNYNTSPKMIFINKKQIAIVNNNDMQAHFNIYQI